MARRGGRRRALTLFGHDAAVEEIEAVAALGGAHLYWGEPSYPLALAAIDDASPVLTVIGDMHLLSKRSVAIVGARNASINGRKIATQIAADLCEAGLTVVAGGVDVIYPKENTALYEQICGRGVVVSEMPPGAEPRGPLFPRRNRIISGLSVGVVVIEAALRSGSLITARLAGEQGRDVYAVPGSPLDPRSRGTNRLIRQGATLIESAADIIEDLSTMPQLALAEPDEEVFIQQPEESECLDRARSAVVEALGPSVDEIVRSLALPVGTVRSILLELELAGRLERQPGNFVTLISD